MQHDENIWMFCTSSNPKDAEELEPEMTYTVDDLLRDIKNKLLERGSYGIRGLARIFRILDNDGGRKLDFISQEMLREANTIASKASSAQISQWVIDIKCAIDRIKEQVQNVE